MRMADLSLIDNVWDRIRADDAYREAMDLRRRARQALRWRFPAYRGVHRDLMHEARRAWRRYARQVRRVSR